MSDADTRAERLRRASAERRAGRKLALRRTILDAATELFLERGFEDFSLRQVAEEIGYSPTTIYHHFADKDELMFTVAMEGMAHFGEELQAGYDSEGEPLTRFVAIGRAYLQFGLSHPLHYRLMFMQRSEWLERKPPDGCESIIDSFSILTQTLRECIEAGQITPPMGSDLRTLSYLVWSQVHGLTALSITTPYLSTEQALGLIEPTLQLILNGLAVRGGDA